MDGFDGFTANYIFDWCICCCYCFWKREVLLCPSQLFSVTCLLCFSSLWTCWTLRWNNHSSKYLENIFFFFLACLVFLNISKVIWGLLSPAGARLVQDSCREVGTSIAFYGIKVIPEDGGKNIVSQYNKANIISNKQLGASHRWLIDKPVAYPVKSNKSLLYWNKGKLNIWFYRSVISGTLCLHHWCHAPYVVISSGFYIQTRA